MKKLLFIFELIPAILASLFAIIFAPVLARFVNLKTRSYPRCLGMFQTPDAPACGDVMWFASNPDMSFYQLCVSWQRRNPAYGLLQWFAAPALPIVDVQGNPAISDGAQGVAGWFYIENADGYFQFQWIHDLGNGRCIHSEFGWNIKDLSAAQTSPVYGALICRPISFYDFTPKK